MAALALALCLPAAAGASELEGVFAEGAPRSTATTPSETGATIASDLADYPPGGLVTLTGGGWVPGETVHVTIEDDDVSELFWQRDVDVTADAAGQIVDQFTLPEWFVAQYYVTATGDQSGVATTSFTDAVLPARGCVLSGALTIEVDTTVDQFDSTSATNECSLREAIKAANGDTATDTITLPAGLYSLTRSGNGESNNETGDLDITEAVKIVGAGARTTFVQNGVAGSAGDRVFDFLAKDSELSGVTVQSGRADKGGGIRLESTTGLKIDEVTVTGNAATDGQGGGIWNDSGASLTITESLIRNNSSTGGDKNGGGIWSKGAITLANVTVTLNTADTDGGGIWYEGGSGRALTATNVTISHNSADFDGSGGGGGGGIRRNSGGTASLRNTIVSNNTGGGGTQNCSGTITNTSHNLETALNTCLFGSANNSQSGVLTDASLDSPANNGGQTDTRALLVGSDAIDKGTATSAPSIDQRQAGRPQDGDLIPGAVHDIGAYEGGPPAPACVTPVVTDDPDAQSITYGDNATFTVAATGTPAPTVQWQVLTTAVGAVWTDIPSATNTTLTITAPPVSQSGYQYRAVFSNGCSLGASDTSAPATLTVAKKPLNVNADPKSKTYGGVDPAFTWTYSGFIAGENAGNTTITGSASCSRAAGESVAGGPYAITCAPGTLTAANYSFVTGSTGNLTIDPLPIEVTADPKSKTYGDADPALTYTITNGSLVGGDSFSGSLGRAAGESVAGSPYAINVGSLSAGPNYTLTFIPANLTITQKQLDVNADPKSKVYGAADPALTWTYSGFEGGDNAGNSNITGSANCTRAAGETVPGGPYAITCAPGTLAAPNYTFATGSPADLTITKKQLDVNADPKSKVYGAADPALTWTYSGFIAGDNAGNSSITGSANCTPAAGETVPGGPYAITCAPGTLAAPNYTFATGSPADLTITPKQLNVNAEPKSKVYGAADPALTWAYSGFIAGDNAGNSSITGAANCTRAAGETVAGSPYAITCAPGTLAAPNYSFATGSPANLTITPKPLTGSFTSADKAYDGNTSATASNRQLAGIVGNDDVSLTGGTATFNNRNVGSGKPVSLAGALLAGADAGNYTLASVTDAAANITAIPVTGSFTSANKVYDGNTSATASNRQLAGVLAGDTVTLTGGTATFDTKNVGTGKPVSLAGASLAGADAGNYTLASVANAAADITAKPLTGAFTAADKDYDGTTAATITGRSLNGAVGSDDVTLTGGEANFVDAEVGENKQVNGTGFQLSGADKDNYTLESVAPTTATIRRGAAPAPVPPPVIDETGNCLRRPVLAFVRGKRISRVVFFLDGKRIARVKTHDEAKRYGVRIDRRELSEGKHKLRAKVYFARVKGQRRASRPVTLGLGLRPCLDKSTPEAISVTGMTAARACPAKPFLAYVKGGTISSVAFTLNGRPLRTVQVADWKGRYAVEIDPADLGPGKNTLEAAVRFIGGSKTDPRVLERELPPCK